MSRLYGRVEQYFDDDWDIVLTQSGLAMRRRRLNGEAIHKDLWVDFEFKTVNLENWGSLIDKLKNALGAQGYRLDSSKATVGLMGGER